MYCTKGDNVLDLITFKTAVVVNHHPKEEPITVKIQYANGKTVSRWNHEVLCLDSEYCNKTIPFVVNLREDIEHSPLIEAAKGTINRNRYLFRLHASKDMHSYFLKIPDIYDDDEWFALPIGQKDTTDDYGFCKDYPKYGPLYLSYKDIFFYSEEDPLSDLPEWFTTKLDTANNITTAYLNERISFDRHSVHVYIEKPYTIPISDIDTEEKILCCVVIMIREQNWFTKEMIPHFVNICRQATAATRK